MKELSTTTNHNPMLNLDTTEIMRWAQIACSGNIFPNINSPEAAAMIILAGQQYGFTPFFALSNIYIVRGKPMVGYALIGAMIKKSKKYSYKILVNTDEKCTIEYFEHKKSIVIYTYTIENARKAQLVKKDSGYDKNPENMLIARNLSNGVKYYMPDLFAGAVYTEGDDFGTEETSKKKWWKKDKKESNIIDIKAPSSEPEKPVEVKNGMPEHLKEIFAELAESQNQIQANIDPLFTIQVKFSEEYKSLTEAKTRRDYVACEGVAHAILKRVSEYIDDHQANLDAAVING